MKKGFTLVELLAVIVILAIILAIAVPTLSTLIDKTKKTASTQSEQLLLRRTETYLSVNGLFPNSVGDATFVSISDMINANMLNSDIRDPRTNQPIDVNNKVFVKKTGSSSYYYRYLQIGSILREVWTGFTGTEIIDFTNNSNYPDKPDIVNYPTTFEAPTDFTEDYGTRMRGYIIPPVTGTYKFWISSDDNSQLWLSTDETVTNKTQIAYVNSWTSSREWTKYAEQQSADIQLEQGKIYYIEALQKEGDGGDNLAVAWQIPGGTVDVIDGQYLAPYFPE